MKRTGIACVSVCFVLTCSLAIAQQPAPTPDRPPVRSVREHTAADGLLPWRVVYTRTASGDREVVVELLETPNLEGRMTSNRETVTETVRRTPATIETRRDVAGFAGDGRRRVIETTESVQETSANGDTNTVHSTFAPDLNGRTALTSRVVERTQTAGPAERQTETTVLVPDVNEPLREVQRTEATERRVDAQTVAEDSIESIRDVNGRWRTTERRTREVRENSGSENIGEQTTHRPDLNGNLAVVERTVARESNANGRNDVEIETYAPSVETWRADSDGLTLAERLRRTTTTTADGGRSVVEEVEGRSRVASGDPMRLVRRTVTTVRPSGTDRWVTEREVFERDVNGRLRRISVETEESSGALPD